jgi:hypothetical protein
VVDLSVLPAAGVAGVLAFVIGYLLRQNYQDRKQYQELLTAVGVQAAAEVAELRAEIKVLRGELEEQRRAKWAAEDAAAHWRRIAEKGSPT